ncbi:MAG: hypothetical protein DHS80DRAFT_29045 [Piptocephalis tieghemiana]|nr:MAG: hypothetical protein DHS80DRAFT_29045 [Piptocephalis tieghemiana]
MPASSIIYYVFLALWSTLALGSLGLFYLFRQKSAIQLRDPLLSIISALLMLLLTNLHLIRLARGFQVPCALLLWIPTYCLPLIALLTMTRYLRLSHLYLVSIRRAEQGITYRERCFSHGEDPQALPMISIPKPIITPPRLERRPSSPQVERMSSQTPIRPSSSHASMERRPSHPHLEGILFNQPLTTMPPSSPPRPIISPTSSSITLIPQYVPIRHITLAERMIHGLNAFLTRNTLSILFTGYITTMTVVLYLIFTTSSKFHGATSTQCTFGWEYVPLYAILLLTTMPALPILLGIKGLQDMYGICLEMRASAWVYSISFLGALLFNLLQATVSLDLPAFPATLWSIWSSYRSTKEANFPCPKVHEDRWASFISIFHQPEQLEVFREYAISEFSVENVLFIEQLWGIRQARLQKGEAGIASCMQLYDQFIRPGAEMELNLRGETLSLIRSQVEGTSFPTHGLPDTLPYEDDALEELLEATEDHGSLESLSPSLFNQAETEILKLIYENTYSRFLVFQKKNP